MRSGSQRHTGFWLLKPVGFCQAPPYPWARRGPTQPASSWARPVYEAVVRGCWGNAGPVPHSEPTDFGSFPRSLDTAAAPASCLGGPLGWKPSDVCVCKHPELTGLWIFPSSSGPGNLLPAVSGGVKTQALLPGSVGLNPAAIGSCLNLPVGMLDPRASGPSLCPSEL